MAFRSVHDSCAFLFEYLFIVLRGKFSPVGFVLISYAGCTGWFCMQCLRETHQAVTTCLGYVHRCPFRRFCFSWVTIDLRTQAQLNTIQHAPCWRRMTSRWPTVRPLALSVFACINVILCWLWWKGIQVERHDIPDPCPYLQGEGLPLLLSSATSADVPALQPGYSENFAAPGSLLKNCTISTGAVKHIQQWQRQLDSHLGPQPTGPPAGLPHCSSTSSLQVDVLQWLTSLHIVPLCPDALPAARRVYTHLASLGGPHDNSVPAYPTCTAIPVASVLEAAGREASPVSGSANSLLAVSLLPPPLGETTSCASDVEALRALPRHADEHAVETDGPEGFGTLQLFVTAPLSKEEVPRLHIGAGSSLLLVVPRRSSGSYSSTGSSSKPSDNALQQAAAGAAVQALGRWVLSPLRDDASFSADLRLRLWLLGDADREANTEGDTDFDVQAKDALRDTEETGAWKRPSTALRPSAPSMLTWDGGAFLRMHLRGILQAISSLVDLQITSQVCRTAAASPLLRASRVPNLLAADCLYGPVLPATKKGDGHIEPVDCTEVVWLYGQWSVRSGPACSCSACTVQHNLCRF